VVVVVTVVMSVLMASAQAAEWMRCAAHCECQLNKPRHVTACCRSTFANAPAVQVGGGWVSGEPQRAISSGGDAHNARSLRERRERSGWGVRVGLRKSNSACSSARIGGRHCALPDHASPARLQARAEKVACILNHLSTLLIQQSGC